MSPLPQPPAKRVFKVGLDEARLRRQSPAVVTTMVPVADDEPDRVPQFGEARRVVTAVAAGRA